jgi:hypothetical protein
MSKAILGFGVSVTRLAALAGSKLASTPSNDDIVKFISIQCRIYLIRNTNPISSTNRDKIKIHNIFIRSVYLA